MFVVESEKIMTDHDTFRAHHKLLTRSKRHTYFLTVQYTSLYIGQNKHTDTFLSYMVQQTSLIRRLNLRHVEIDQKQRTNERPLRLHQIFIKINDIRCEEIVRLLLMLFAFLFTKEREYFNLLAVRFLYIKLILVALLSRYFYV